MSEKEIKEFGKNWFKQKKSEQGDFKTFQIDKSYISKILSNTYISIGEAKELFKKEDEMMTGKKKRRKSNNTGPKKKRTKTASNNTGPNNKRRNTHTNTSSNLDLKNGEENSSSNVSINITRFCESSIMLLTLISLFI